MSGSLDTTGDVTVIGAGPVGLLAALLFARAGRRVEVLERSPVLGTPPGGVILQPGTLGLLDGLGLRARIEAAGRPLSGVDEVDPDGAVTSVDYADLAGSPVPYSLAVPLRVLRDTLLEALPAPTVVHTGVELTGLAQDPDGVTLRTADGAERRAALVVGADGKHSTTRVRAGLTAEVAAFPRAQLICALPRPAGWPDRIRSRRGPDPYVVIPSTAERLHVFGDVDVDPDRVPPADVVAALAATITAREPALGARVRDEATHVATIRHHTVVVEQWTRGRVALVGDSAHTVHPYGGQGVNLGLHDAAVLAGTSAEPAGLARYEALRRPFVEGFQHTQRRVLGDTDHPSPYAGDFAALALGQPEARALLVTT